MKQLNAFLGKEFLAFRRSGKSIVLTLLFILFGFISPVVTQLVPKLMDLLSEDLAASGMNVISITANALVSWFEFFEGMPIMLIVFIILFSSGITGEGNDGTLINMLTKGLRRRVVVISKFLSAIVIWSIGYLLSAAITYIYNMIVWDNGIVKNLFFACFGLWLMGVWLISIIYLASGYFKSTFLVMLSVGASYILALVLSFFKYTKAYSPLYITGYVTQLTEDISLVDYIPALLITLFLIAFNIFFAIKLFDKKQI